MDIENERRLISMNERLTWDEIVEKYPDQWVGLVDVDWEDGANVRSAIVKYTDKTSGELARMQIKDSNLYSTYTTPDNLAPLGVVGYMG